MATIQINRRHRLFNVQSNQFWKRYKEKSEENDGEETSRKSQDD
jgi:hypothetical protein